MISNNKNKNSKELTLEEIIHKSKFRKNIDNICLLETKINKDYSKPTSLISTPISAFNKPFPDPNKFQNFQSKRSIHSTHEPHRKTSNSVTARTTQSFKEPISEPLLPQQVHHNNFKTVNRDELPTKEFKKSKENNRISLQKPKSLKAKVKNANSFLCVKGASGNVVINLPKPMTAETNSRDYIPEYEMKKYQTLVELGSDLQQKQKSQQLKPSLETIENKKYHSFMVTKYTTSNNLHQRSVKSKSYSQSKLKHKILLPEEIIRKKIEYRGIKTEEKISSKVDNAEESGEGKSKRIKKYELILNINHEEQIRKQLKHKIKNEITLDNQDENALQHFKKTALQVIQQELVEKKTEKQDAQNQAKVKGFKGKKVKSTVQMKTRYFVPDFIKPSLDLIVFDKKQSEKIKTEQKQVFNKKNQFFEEQTVNRTFQQIAQGITGKQINPNSNQLIKFNQNGVGNQENWFQQVSEITKEENFSIEQQEYSNQIVPQPQKNQKNQKNSRSKLKKKIKNYEEADICAWSQSNHKNTGLQRDFEYEIDF